MWILSVCVGILWGGMCDRIIHIKYPSQQACEFERKKVNGLGVDAYATCFKEEKKDNVSS